MKEFPHSEVQRILEETARDYPEAFKRAHSFGDPAAADFMILSGRRCKAASGGSVLCNWSRGVVGDLAQDGLSFYLEGMQYEWYFEDCIDAAGSPDATINVGRPGAGWELRDASGAYIGEAGTADPDAVDTSRDWDAVGALTCQLGASLFCAVDLYLTDRERLNHTLAWYADKVGALYVRIFLKKGTAGDPADYWVGYVRGLADLTVETIGGVIDHCYGEGMSVAPVVFADNLNMSMDDQDELVRRYIEAARSRLHKIPYHVVFNEPYPDGQETGNTGHGGDWQTLQRHGQALRAGLGPDAWIALGTPQCHMGLEGQDLHDQVRRMYGGEGRCANLITVHFDRSEQLPPDLGPDAPSRRINDEPRGPGASGVSIIDPALLGDDLLATDHSSYAGYVYHSRQGIKPDAGEVWETENADAIAYTLKTTQATGVNPASGGALPGPDEGDIMRPYPGDAAIAEMGQQYLDDKGEAKEGVDNNSFVWTNRPQYSYDRNERHLATIADDGECWREAVKVHRYGWPEEQGAGGWRGAMGLPPKPDRP